VTHTIQTYSMVLNPFLHMGLHLAVREQVSIDRPPGVRELHRLLQARYGALHRAEHALMEALGEALWQAQRAGKPPDEEYYLAAARRHLEPPAGIRFPVEQGTLRWSWLQRKC